MTEDETTAKELLESELRSIRATARTYELEADGRRPLVRAIVVWRLAALYRAETELIERWAQLVDGAKE